jgi:phospholipid/cholesterol/gamma-HCH transport system substrate-binding protein
MKHSSRMRELTMEIVVGTFLFVVLLFLSFFTIILSRERMFAKTFPFEVVFQEVMGLRDGDNVVMRGMTIGKVKALEMKPDGVHLRCELDAPVTLRVDYGVRIISSSILGGRYLQIDPGSSSQPPLPESQIPRGTDPVDLMDEAATVVRQVRRTLDEGQVLSNVEVAVRSLREISEKINAGEGTLGQLVNDAQLYTDARDVVAELKESIQKRQLLVRLEESAENLRDISDKINAGEGTLGRLVNDPALYDDAAEVVREVRVAVQQRQLLANLEKTVSNLEAITDRVNRGEGTVGKFINDETLYREMSRLVADARAALDDLRELSPIGTFSSVLFGAF